MENERNFLPKPEKPPVLYHASSRSDITEFEPRAGKTRDPKEGPRIFATPSKALATVFLVESDDSWTISGSIDDVPFIGAISMPFIIIGDEQRYKALDKGGTIYSLPSGTFETDAAKGLGELEWTSKRNVTPIGKDEYPSALDAMIANGVQVYFTDMATLSNIKTLPADRSSALIRSLKSENQKRLEGPQS